MNARSLGTKRSHLYESSKGDYDSLVRSADHHPPCLLALQIGSVSDVCDGHVPQVERGDELSLLVVQLNPLGFHHGSSCYHVDHSYQSWLSVVPCAHQLLCACPYYYYHCCCG